MKKIHSLTRKDKNKICINSLRRKPFVKDFYCFHKKGTYTASLHPELLCPIIRYGKAQHTSLCDNFCLSACLTLGLLASR